ncbi:hypothetical protein BJ085DRAFT_41302 [Dimargaris cristalligena]|uniref:Uncharacterized protein n=1 Tax=Dimargaris cristalligena TaxID=215637 RepID=A0A4P9ZPQ1_9FUNG|nr:hypothetical protein BJ085DRAFT_41302 [Dimargaris cristalligena]|eukprot:RKP35416.1 hypothetical protein BJ085DRAFT_41302 [Dimargaris cristalligena]
MGGGPGTSLPPRPFNGPSEGPPYPPGPHPGRPPTYLPAGHEHMATVSGAPPPPHPGMMSHRPPMAPRRGSGTFHGHQGSMIQSPNLSGRSPSTGAVPAGSPAPMPAALGGSVSAGPPHPARPPPYGSHPGGAIGGPPPPNSAMAQPPVPVRRGRPSNRRLHLKARSIFTRSNYPPGSGHRMSPYPPPHSGRMMVPGHGHPHPPSQLQNQPPPPRPQPHTHHNNAAPPNTGPPPPPNHMMPVQRGQAPGILEGYSVAMSAADAGHPRPPPNMQQPYPHHLHPQQYQQQHQQMAHLMQHQPQQPSSQMYQHHPHLSPRPPPPPTNPAASAMVPSKSMGPANPPSTEAPPQPRKSKIDFIMNDDDHNDNNAMSWFD